MGSNSFKQLSFIGGADIVGTAITTVFWFFIASQVSPEDYGELYFLIGIAATAAAFVIVGAQNSITVYVAKKINIESTLYFFSIILGIVATLIIMVFFYKIDVVFLLFGYIISTLAIGQILGNKSFALYSKHTLIQKIATFAFGILLFIAFGVEGIIFALALSYVFFSVIVFKAFRETKINFSLLKERSKFIFNNHVVAILTQLNNHLNKFLIVPILGFAILGEFTLAQQLVNAGMIFTLIVFKYTLAHDAQGEENKKLKKFNIIFAIIVSILGFFIGPMIVPILFPEYVEIVDILRIITFCIIPLTLTKIFTSKLLGAEHSKRILYSKIISIVTFLTIILVLSPEFGLIALGIGYLLSTISETLCLIPRMSFGKINNS